MIRPHARALSAAAVAVVSLWASPVSAGPRPSIAELIGEAQIALDSEILALVELDAFGPDVPQELLDVHATWETYVSGLDRDGLIAWVVDADADGAEVLRQLDLAAVPLPAEVRRTVGPLDRVDLEALVLGEGAISIDPTVYVRARGQLTSDAPPVTAPPVAGQPATTPSAQPTATSDGSGPALAAVLGLSVLGLIVLAAIAWAIVRRRPRADRAVTPAMREQLFDQLADAARRLTNALDQQEIAGIALDEALAMVRARHGAFVAVDELGLTAVATSGDVFALRSLTGGLLSRVADTGQTVRRVAYDEPAITSLPAAILAAPVIGGGRVVAILFVVRGDATPFSDDDEAAVTRLTPIVASALAAATKHGDATALSRIDPLTGLANRRTLDEDLARVRDVVSAGRCTAVAMVDVDHFKEFNDREGHAAGDEALRTVARALQAGVRPDDRVYRYGGEEFSLLLPDVDPLEAELVTERVRELVEESRPPGSAGQPGGSLTISIGVVLVNGADPEASLLLADRALYEAKASGRNRVVLIDATNAET